MPDDLDQGAKTIIISERASGKTNLDITREAIGGTMIGYHHHLTYGRVGETTLTEARHAVQAAEDLINTLRLIGWTEPS